MSLSGVNLSKEIDNWKKNKTEKNWKLVLAAARKHTLSSEETGRYDDVNGIGLDDESDILALIGVPESKCLEIIRNCK
tara:strand:- start:882 stop:1115 length:234 start_codon:yes stop_codon:yes gene_type:complete